MSEIKPVYQRRIQDDDWQEIERSEYVEFSERGKFQTRILYHAAAYEALQKENAELKESNLELERLCDRTYVQQGADAYNHCCEVFESWRVKRKKLHLPTHDWADGLYNSLSWMQYTVEELEIKSAAQAKRIAELEKCVEILQRPLDDEIISRIVCLVKNIPDEELASNVFESVRNMTNWNKSTPAEFLVLFDKTAATKNGE